MKTALASLIGATAASACCIGPVVFALAGVGALSASAMSLEPYRPAFLGATGILMAVAFWREYRVPAACPAGAHCPPDGRWRRRLALWLIASLVVALAAFPYYVNAII